MLLLLKGSKLHQNNFVFSWEDLLSGFWSETILIRSCVEIKFLLLTLLIFDGLFIKIPFQLIVK